MRNGKIQLSIEDISPEKAREFLDKNQHNRPISDDTVNYYADLMNRGQWILSPEGISFDIYGILLDGQHRLAAIVKSETTQKFIVSRGFPRDIFKTLNTGRPRSIKDVFNIEDINNAQLIGTSIKKLLFYRKGIYSGREGTKRMKMSNNDFLEEYENNPELFQLLAKKSQMFYSRIRILPSSDLLSYMAYFIIDHKKNQDDVIEFFKQVTSYSDNHAINEFRVKLMKARDMKSYRLTDTQRHVFLLKAWNSFITGIPEKELKYSEKEGIPEFK